MFKHFLITAGIEAMTEFLQSPKHDKTRQFLKRPEVQEKMGLIVTLYNKFIDGAEGEAEEV